MTSSVTQTNLQPKPKRITHPVPFLWGLEDGQSWKNTIGLGLIWFAGEGLRQYEQGFMLGRQALKRRERAN